MAKLRKTFPTSHSKAKWLDELTRIDLDSASDLQIMVSEYWQLIYGDNQLGMHVLDDTGTVGNRIATVGFGSTDPLEIMRKVQSIGWIVVVLNVV